MRPWMNRAGLTAFGLAAVAATFVLPRMVEMFTLLELTIYVIMAILALSLAFVWGYAGILCFGQAAFFGLGAYTYAIAVINLGESTGAFALAIVVPAVFAGVLGYFMFYGRVSDVYLGVITLTVSLILFNLVNSTAGDAYRIGKAPLGGFNGIPSIPTLNLPGDPAAILDPQQFFQFCVLALTLVYYGLRAVLASRFGRIIVAVKENEKRVELLGFDARLFKLGAFVVGGAVAGLAGCLFANWGAFVSPTVFGLAQSAQIIIWVIVGGLGTLVGPILGAFLIQWLTSWLGAVNLVNTNLVLGVVLVAFVLLVPKGLIPSLVELGRRALSRRQPAAETPADGTQPAAADSAGVGVTAPLVADAAFEASRNPSR